jgi:hypothetical protein
LVKIAQILDIEAKTIVPNQKRLNYIHQSYKNLHQTPSKLLKYLQQTLFPPKKLSGPLKSSQNCGIRPIWSLWLEVVADNIVVLIIAVNRFIESATVKMMI